MTLPIAIIGANGFVGSAFARYLKRRSAGDVVEVTRDSYAIHAGQRFSMVIDASCNSNKRLADEDPRREFDLSVAQRLRTLLDFPAEMQVHVSSVDVYSDLASSTLNAESTGIDIRKSSNYGFHKLVAEDLVRHYASRWLVVRLAGMVGERMKKNPVFDILNNRPLYIHPDSQYQFMSTDDVARIVIELVDRGLQGETINVCGDGLVSPRHVASIAGRELRLSDELGKSVPRIVDVNISKLKALTSVPRTVATVTDFVKAWKSGSANSNV